MGFDWEDILDCEDGDLQEAYDDHVFDTMEQIDRYERAYDEDYYEED